MTYLPLETEGCKNNTGNVHITMRWGKKIHITYSECVFVALCIQYAMCMHHIVIFPVCLYSILPHHLINGTISGGEN